MTPTETQNQKKRGFRPLILLPLVVLAAIPLFLALRTPASFHGTAWDPPMEATDFTLVDHNSDPASLSDHRGSTVLLFFGFVNCPDVCPLTLSRLSRVLDQMDADTSEVKVLLVTVDPERDSPEALANYVSRFGPHVIGLTGDSASLAEVRSSFHAHAARQQEPSESPVTIDHGQHAGHEMPAGVDPGVGGTGTFSHTTQVFGIDRSGLVRVLISPEFAEETIRDDIKTLMRM